jgi:O-antigen biosynthesis protein
MISIFTPTHDAKFLKEAYQSILSQTFTDWEWVLLLNNGLTRQQLPPEIALDLRVVIQQVDTVSGVGEAKALACELTKGEILLELDHDDKLLPEALADIDSAFRHSPSIVAAYTNAAQINEDGSPNMDEWGAVYGWKYRETNGYHECISFDPHPHNMSFIWYAPNHARAFRRTAYFEVGGYNPECKVLDDQDLMMRLYTLGEFLHIDKLLYLQRVYPAQTQKDPATNAFIQKRTVEMHGENITKMAAAWAKRRGLKVLDMGAAHRKPEGFEGCDIDDLPGVDYVFDANGKWPFEDGSVGVIRAVDFLEHVQDKLSVIREIYRVLAHGGILLSMTPSTDGRGAFQDPTHVAYYNENSFWYYTRKAYRDFIHGLEVEFQESNLWTDYPSDWHRQNQVSYVHAHLIALKQESRDFGGITHF